MIQNSLSSFIADMCRPQRSLTRFGTLRTSFCSFPAKNRKGKDNLFD
jgi:hypothetical protein